MSLWLWNVPCLKLSFVPRGRFPLVASLLWQIFVARSSLSLLHASSAISLPMRLYPCFWMSFSNTLSNLLAFVFFQEPGMQSAVLTCFPVTGFFWLLTAWLNFPLACFVLRLHWLTPYSLALSIRYHEAQFLWCICSDLLRSIIWIFDLKEGW